MNIVVVGSGAMGLLFLKQLKPKSEVHLKHRRFEDVHSSYMFTDINGLTSEMHYQTSDKSFLRTADIILICVKSFHIKDVILDIEHLVSPTSIIILMHNGMGVVEELSLDKISKNPIYTMLSTQAARKLSPKHLRHTGLGINQIGNVVNPISDSKIESILNNLSSADITFEFTQDISVQQWKKLSINCAINALTAINDVANGDLSAPQYDELIEKVTREVVTVAQLEGASLNLADLLHTIKTVIHNTSANSSSMREDVLNKRRTEVEYINGYIHKLGVKHGYLTPSNTQLFEQIRNIEACY